MQSPLLAFDLQLNGRSPSGDADFSPRLCVGFLFLILYPALPGPAASHNFVTYSLSHTTLSHAIFHTQLCHTLFHTHNFVTHSLSHTTLSHTTLSHTIFHTQLCHTLSFTHNFVTPHLSHALFHTQLCHTPFFTHNFVTRMALGEIHLRFAWQAWRCTASTFVLRGRRGWHLRHWAGSGGALGRRLGAAGRVVTPRHFAWQVLATSTFTLRGRHGAWRHQGWHFTTSTFVLRGNHGASGTGLGLVALALAPLVAR